MLRVRHHAQAEERNDKDSARSEVLAPKGLGGEAPHPLGTKEGGWKRGGMRRSCQNSLLTAKVTTLFPGPKRDNGRPEKVYIKADRAAYTPLPLDR